MRFVHLVYSDSIHTQNIIEMLQCHFYNDNHLVLTSSESLYEKYGNNHVVLDKSISKASGIKKYYSEDVVFISHSMVLSTVDIYKLPRKILKRMVWVVWGHDLYITPEKGVKGSIKTVAKKARRMVRFHRYNLLCGIGIGFCHDSIEIRKLSSKCQIFNMLYCQSKIKAMDEMTKHFDDKTVKVMIGHSAFSFLNHKKNIDRLSKYKNENIVISLVLSYGSQDYARSVIEHAKKTFGSAKIEVILEKQSFEDYVEYIKGIDIAIFDYEHQSALGNIFLLMYLGKKLYFSADGILYQSAVLDGWLPCRTDSIGEIDFDDFSKPLDSITKKRMKTIASYYYDKELSIMNWRNSFITIEEKVKRYEQ